MRVLLIEDDLTIADFVRKGLKEAGFVVEHASDGQTGLQMALNSAYDAAVIDLMLPGLDGLAVIDKVRQRRIRMPVIILSAKRSVDERVEGLQAGGDDYLTKPFAFSELLARIQALIRRASATPEPTGQICRMRCFRRARKTRWPWRFGWQWQRRCSAPAWRHSYWMTRLWIWTRGVECPPLRP